MSYSDKFLEYKFAKFKYDNETKNLTIKAYNTGFVIFAQSEPLRIYHIFDKDEKRTNTESLLMAVKVAASHFGKLTQTKEGVDK
jgi:hypothetical protein